MSLSPSLAVAAREPGVNRNAAELLRQRGILVTRIVRVNPESILYLGSNRRPMTAWLTYTAGRLDIRFEPGFQAWPDPRISPPQILSRAIALDDLDYDQA